MLGLVVAIAGAARAVFRSRSSLVAENLALRQHSPCYALAVDLGYDTSTERSSKGPTSDAGHEVPRFLWRPRPGRGDEP